MLTGDFCKGNGLQGCKEGEQGAGQHRRNRLRGCENCPVSAFQPGHLFSFLPSNVLQCTKPTKLGFAQWRGGNPIEKDVHCPARIHEARISLE